MSNELKLWQVAPPLRHGLIVVSLMISTTLATIPAAGQSQAGVAGAPTASSNSSPSSPPSAVQPPPPSPSAQRLDYWDKATSIADKVFKMLALVVGAVFAYVKFFMGRTFRPRLESSVSGSVIESNGQRHLALRAVVKNVGLTKCAITQVGSGVRILSYTDDAATNLGAEAVFERHKWIESGETVVDEFLTSLGSDKGLAYQLELELTSANKTWIPTEKFPYRRRDQIVWVSRGVVGVAPLQAEGGAET